MMNGPQQQNNLPAFLKQFDPLATLEPVKVWGNNTSHSNSELNGSFSSLRREKDIYDLIDNLFVTQRQACSNSSFEQDLISFLDKYEEQAVGKLVDIPDDKEPGSDEASAPEKLNEFEQIKAQNEALLKALQKCIEMIKDTPDFTNVKGSMSNVNPEVVVAKHKPDLKPNDDINKLKSKNVPSVNQIKTNEYKLFIEMVAKDPKVFTKRRLVKSQIETSKYTKGANFYEKTIVLPQIMKRLTEHKLNGEFKKNLTKIMVLDSKGAAETKHTDDKKNTLDFPTCKASVIKVDAVNSPKMVPIGDAVKKKPIQINVGTIDNTKNIGAVKINSDKTPNTSGLIDITKIPGLKDIEKKILTAMVNTPSTSKVNDKPNGVKKSEGVTLSPEVLMEDCNKQRLIEFIKRRLFQSFVNGDI